MAARCRSFRVSWPMHWWSRSMLWWSSPKSLASGDRVRLGRWKNFLTFVPANRGSLPLLRFANDRNGRRKGDVASLDLNSSGLSFSSPLFFCPARCVAFSLPALSGFPRSDCGDLSGGGDLSGHGCLLRCGSWRAAAPGCVDSWQKRPLRNPFGEVFSSLRGWPPVGLERCLPPSVQRGWASVPHPPFAAIGLRSRPRSGQSGTNRSAGACRPR